MRNPYLRQQSLRTTLFMAIFPLLAAKFITLVLLLSVASENSFTFDPFSGMALLVLGFAVVLDLFTLYHLTTRWHRLNRHPWVMFPGAVVNLVLAALAMVPAPFAVILQAIQRFLGDSPGVTWGIWFPMGLGLILAFVQLVVSLRLALRLRQQNIPRPIAP